MWPPSSMRLATNVTMIDTAIAYGQSEMVLGKAGVSDSRSSARYLLCRTNRVPSPLIAIKSPDLLTCCVVQLYAVLLHNADDLATPLGEIMLPCWIKCGSCVQNWCVDLSSPAAGTHSCRL